MASMPGFPSVMSILDFDSCFTGVVVRQERLRQDLCEWLRWLQKRVGFNGWRFDFVKGYAGEAVKVCGSLYRVLTGSASVAFMRCELGSLWQTKGCDRS